MQFNHAMCVFCLTTVIFVLFRAHVFTHFILTSGDLASAFIQFIGLFQPLLSGSEAGLQRYPPKIRTNFRKTSPPKG